MRARRGSARAAFGALVLAALLTGCGGDGGTSGEVATGTRANTVPSSTLSSSTPGEGLPTSDVPGEERPSSSSNATAEPPSGSSPGASSAQGPSPAEGPSPLQRRETPPGGVAAQFAVGSLGAAPGCRMAVEAGDEIRVAIGDRFTVCITYSAEPVDAAVEVTRPDGSSATPSLDSDGSSFIWTVELGDPLGRYTVTAEQGSVRLAASFVVEVRRRPTMLDLAPLVGPPGTVFGVGLAGFPAHQQVQLDLYRFVGRDGGASLYEFRTTLSSVGTDARGEARFRLPTRPDDPQGAYCIVPRGVDWERPPGPVSGGCAGFQVGTG